MSFAFVIDDSRQAAEALVQMLQIWDMDARVILNPAAAMSILETEIPKVIFLDINMPGVDGFEVIGFLKREPRLNGVPIIVVTSDDQPETRERAINCGAADVVIKPAMIEFLEQALKKTGLLENQ